MKYGHLELHIEELLKEKGISKNTICKELDIPIGLKKIRAGFCYVKKKRKRSEVNEQGVADTP